jgi:cell wall-associated NlpC family hydrolase
VNARRTACVGLLLLALPVLGQDLTADRVPASGLRAVIAKHLGRPYVWGSAGLKSFDCSGFVWRVMFDNGILIKRTTARRLYLCLPRVGEGQELQLGNLVFFDNLAHCGIVNDPDTFYHSQCSKGTNLSNFEPYWRNLVCGFRAMPGPSATPLPDLDDRGP